MALEPRLMFDGAAAADAVLAVSDGTPPPSPPASAPPREVAFVDSSVAGYQSLVDGIRPGIEVVVLEGARDGLAQMAEWAASHSGFDAIHVLGHGSEGQVALGTASLDAATLDGRASELSALGSALTADGDLLLYGCDVAKGTDGIAFIGNLAAATGADVAASDDWTGAADRQGDWVLEAATGAIEATAALTDASSFHGVLVTYATQDFSSATIGNAASLTIDTITYSVNGGGTVAIDANAGGYVGLNPLPGGMAAVGLIANGGMTQAEGNITTFTMASADTANNYKLTSLVIGVNNSNFGTYTITGYDNAIQTAQVTGVDITAASATYGTGADAVGYNRTLNAVESWGGTLTFSGSGWGNIDRVVFTRTNNKDLLFAMDSITFAAAVVANTAPSNSVVPAVSGGTTVGGTAFSTTTGTWSDAESNPITYAYQWQRADDAAGTNAADIGGATSGTYTATTSEAHKYVRAVVTASDGSLTASANSAWTAVTNSAPVNTVAPAITGTNTVGNQLTAGSGTWTDADGDSRTYSYAWYRADDAAGTNAAAIAGATASTYTLTTTEAHKYVRAVLTANDGNGSTNQTGTSAWTAVANSAPVNTVAPAITGTSSVGNQLTAGNGTWTDADEDSRSYTYQWYRADDAGGTNAAAIAGATASSYTLTTTDAHKYVRAVVNCNDGNGGSTNGSSAWTAVTNSAPVNTVAPAITGTSAVGNQLTVGNGTWTDADGDSRTYSYAWYRADDAAGTNAAAIAGATASTYTLTTSEAHKYVRAVLTANDGNGSTNQTGNSAWTQVTNALPALAGMGITIGANDNTTTTPFAFVTVTDVDADNVSIAITYTAANGTLTGTGLTGSAGSYTLSSTDTATLQTRLRALTFTPTANQVAPDSTTATTFTLTPNDGTGNGTADGTTVVTATSINNAPVVTAGGTMAYTEMTPAAVATGITITDADVDSDWVGGNGKLTVQITTAANANDRLYLPTANPGAGGVWVDVSAANALKIDTTTIGAASAATVTAGNMLTFTFTGATDSQVESVARAIMFTTDSTSPDTTERAVTFTAYDKTSGSHSGARAISVTATPDKPTLSGLTSSATATAFVEDTVQTTPAQVFSAGTIADTDSTHFNGGYLRITGSGTGDLLTVRNQGTGAGQIGLAGSTVSYGNLTIGTIDGTESGAAGTALKINFSTTDATIAAANALLQNILFSTGDAPSAARTLSVTVQDGTAAAASTAATAVVNVTASNDQPGAISDSNGGANTVAENASVGATVGVTAASTDPDGTAVTYSLTDSAGGKFAIGGASGVVTVASALDFETATSHSITVQASDGTLTRTQSFTINVTNVDETPVITSATTTATVAESAATTTPVIDVNGNDGDNGAQDTGLTYTIQSGNTGNAFAIDPNTGAITVNAALDRETTASYTLVVRATDAGNNFVQQTITVTISDVNDNAPVISSGGGGATAAVTINENATTVTTVTATDADTTGTKTFSISGGADAAKFSIDQTTGALTFATAPNFEAPTDQGATAGNNTYVVDVRVSDGVQTDTQTITVTIADVDEAPVFTSGTTISAQENQPLALNVDANDGDGGAADAGVTYSIVGAANGFSINAAGQLSAAGKTAGTHSVTVRATDAGAHSTDQTITATVTAPPPPPPPQAPPKGNDGPTNDTGPKGPGDGGDKGAGSLSTIVRDPGKDAGGPTFGPTLGPTTVTLGPVGPVADSTPTAPRPDTNAAARPTGPAAPNAVSLAPAGLTAPTATSFQVVVAAKPAGGGDALVVNSPVRDAAVAEGARISVQVPAEAFAHTKADAAVTLAATRADGAALPGWMAFNPQTGTFEGTPPPGFKGEVVVKVVARDSEGREAVQTFKIVVGEAGQGRSEPGAGQSGDGQPRDGQQPQDDQPQDGQPQGAGPDRQGFLKPAGKPSLTAQLKLMGREGRLAKQMALIEALQRTGKAA